MAADELNDTLRPAARHPVCPVCQEVHPDAEGCPGGSTLKRQVVAVEPAFSTLERSEDPLVGVMAGEYRIEAPLGRGGLGIVYRALHPAIGKAVAIKVLKWELASDPEQARRLTEEAQAVNAVGHRGIVDIFGTGRLEDGRQYLAMELLEGLPLDRLIATEAPLPLARALELTDALADVLDAAHCAGVIHRDLKPNNLFLVKPSHGAPYLKVLDFGLAKRTPVSHGTTPQTRSNVMVGTPMYMAPEQARGHPVGPATDLYAVGVILFEMLTARRPYEAETHFEVVALHLNAPVPRPSEHRPELSADVDELVAKLLAKNPGDRFASARALREAIAAVPRPSLSKAEAPSAPESPARAAEATSTPPPRARGGRRAWIVSAICVGVAMVVFGALASAQRAETPALAPLPVSMAAASAVPVAPPGPRVEAVELEAAAPVKPQVPERAAPLLPPARPERPRPLRAPKPPAPAPAPTPVLAPVEQEAPVEGSAEPLFGRLELAIYPFGDVYVDGQLKASEAQRAQLDLPAGEHEVTLTHPTYGSWKRTLTVSASGSRVHRINLSRDGAGPGPEGP